MRDERRWRERDEEAGLCLHASTFLMTHGLDLRHRSRPAGPGLAPRPQPAAAQPSRSFHITSTSSITAPSYSDQRARCPGLHVDHKEPKHTNLTKSVRQPREMGNCFSDPSSHPSKSKAQFTGGGQRLGSGPAPAAAPIAPPKPQPRYTDPPRTLGGAVGGSPPGAGAGSGGVGDEEQRERMRQAAEIRAKSVSRLLEYISSGLEVKLIEQASSKGVTASNPKAGQLSAKLAAERKAGMTSPRQNDERLMVSLHQSMCVDELTRQGQRRVELDWKWVSRGQGDLLELICGGSQARSRSPDHLCRRHDQEVRL